jgi:hypothetical protein
MTIFYNTEKDEPRWGALVAALLAVLIAVPVIWFGVRWITAGPRGQLQAREQIQSGDFRIQAYNHFFDLCAAVQTDEATLDATVDQLRSSSDPTDRQRLLTNKTGQLAARAEAINQYNVDARKSYTEGQFRGNGLPYQLPVTYEPGAHTSCAS